MPLEPTFTLLVAAATNADVPLEPATVTIVDDDDRPTIEIPVSQSRWATPPPAVPSRSIHKRNGPPAFERKAVNSPPRWLPPSRTPLRVRRLAPRRAATR